MAYITQEQKKEIAAKLKKIIPSTWKYSLSILHHSKLVLKISQGDFTIFNTDKEVSYKEVSYLGLNVYHLKNHFSLPANNHLYYLFERILGAMNTGNHDNSDIQSDYFDVGWYTDIKIGQYDKPFVSTDDKQAIREFKY